MKKLFLAFMLAVGFATAQAQVTGNLGLTSDYRYRGVSQTQNAPAVQGGIDYAHSSGLYVGNWNSSVSSQVYTNGSGIESDLYAGFKKDVYKGITIDVGSYNYFYPRATTTTGGNNFDTNELYAGVGYGPASVKYSQSLSNYFGIANSKNSEYFQADVNYVLPFKGFDKVSLIAHAGRTNVNNNSNLNYSDYNAGVGYDLQGWNLAVKYYTNTSEGSAFQSANTVSGQKLYKNATVLSVTKAFE
jgi:uncharacterized protein (TIGR02001 family)